ncbi:hypothetical protein Rumeso_01058 [Rubellimicrobium mesophilum DSM 19309]|uniref:DUF6881 domain-containing protein n=1 Tax=Rubellimicrobium mesophilum DSM 19309 TaxID=442562 RepID=A0A017HSI9_9RHOB|nr:hypothetical protein [Rubellimicrobium mesophilum]EYD77351.1 hypothetical protein Rumeso_01058 [Rubellimicrobium mesophilum DSM 19309]
MKYYHAAWTHDLPDEPVWMAYEVSEDGNVTRMVEHFAVGWTDYRMATREECENLIDQPFDPAAFDEEAMTLREITPDWFAGLWRKQDAS